MSPLDSSLGGFVDICRFLTFSDGTTPAALLHRRQNTDQPMVYNATQSFSTVSGTEYHLSAAAIMAQNGASPPSCTINICATNSDCSGASPLATNYTTYPYNYLARISANYTVATFSIACLGPAYVGLDEISIIANSRDAEDSAPPTNSDCSGTAASSGTDIGFGGSSSAALDSGTLSGQSVRTVTRTIARTRTATATYSTVYYYTATQYVTSIEPQSSFISSQLVPTTVVETATAYQNLTLTSTTTITQTATTNQISTAYVTKTSREVQTTVEPPVTETTVVPYSTYVYETLVSTVYPNASTITSVETLLSTAYSTIVQTLSQTITSREVTTVSGSVITQYVTSTSLQPTTVIQTSITTLPPSTLYITATSLLPYNVTYVLSYLTTLNIIQTLPQAIATATTISQVVSTQLVPVTYTTEVLRTSTYISSVPDPTSIVYSTIEVVYTSTSTYVSTLIRNETVLSVLPASTTIVPGPTSYLTITTEILRTSTYVSSVSGPTSIVYSTIEVVYTSTSTYISTLIRNQTQYQTVLSNLPASTILQTTTVPGPTSYQTVTMTSILPASTVVTTQLSVSSAAGVTSTYYTTYIVTQPASTYTYISTLISTEPRTITATSYAPPTTLPGPTSYQTVTLTSTLPASTFLTTQTLTSSAPGTTAILTYPPTNNRFVNTNRTAVVGPLPSGQGSDGVPIFNVPVPVTMCGLTTSTVQMSVNGVRITCLFIENPANLLFIDLRYRGSKRYQRQCMGQHASSSAKQQGSYRGRFRVLGRPLCQRRWQLYPRSILYSHRKLDSWKPQHHLRMVCKQIWRHDQNLPIHFDVLRESAEYICLAVPQFGRKRNGSNYWISMR